MKNKDFYTVFTEQTPSTMDLAKSYIQNNPHQGNILAIMTRNQTFGRGRGGSTWKQSELKEDSTLKQTSELIFFNNFTDAVLKQNEFIPVTFVIPNERIKVPYEWVTSLIGCAIYDSLTTTENFIKSTIQSIPYNLEKSIFIKWPNDIIVFPNKFNNMKDLPEYKKLCGILCETNSIGNKIGDFFIGIGLNFFSHPSIEKSTSFWESLFLNTSNKSIKREINKLYKSNEFRSAILNKFCDILKHEIIDYICSPRNIEQLKSLVMDRSIPKGSIISVDKGTRQGEFLGIDNNAGLLLSGSLTPIISGDISLKQKSEIKKTTQKTENSKNIIPTLAIDFGNTTIHIGYQSSNLTHYNLNLSYDTIFKNDTNSMRESFKSILNGFINDRKQKINILYTSVNTPEKTKVSLTKIKEYITNIFPEILFHETKISEQDIFNCIEISGNFEIGRIGADRALKFLFASKQAKALKENIITFSFGTAVTCEGVSSASAILENFIFPGIQMAFNAIHHYTALVPLFQANPEMFSVKDNLWNQEIYVQRGIFLSAAASVITVIKMHSPCKCYFSGGNADSILKIINLIYPDHNLNIEILPHIETDMILKYKDLLLKNSANIIKEKKELLTDNLKKIKNIIEENSNKKLSKPEKINNENDIHSVMQSMIKARDPKTINRIKEPTKEDFRKIGNHIENIENEERIDAYMANKFQFHNRETWRERISNGEVLIEHGANKKDREKIHLNKIKPTYKLKNYDQIWLFHPHEYEPDVIEKIDVIFDDGDLCIFSKPPNMVIHAAGIYGRNTFVNISAKMGYSDCSAVHRIDRETSGILACARKSETRNIISEAFRQGNIQKMYIAVSKGKNKLPDKFRVKLPIGEPQNSLIRLKLWVNGNLPQQAETWFSKLATFEDYTMFACLPKTGRTNQIRIHLAAIGHWIVGDKMYHDNEQVFIHFYENGYTDWVHEQTLFPRHMLHNAGIMASNIKLPSLSEIPIVCEIYSDMMNSEIVMNLLKSSSIPSNPILQREFLKNTFIQLHKINFNEYPEVSLGESNE